MLSGRSNADAGSAMVVTLLVMVVLSGLGAVVFTTATSNLENSGRDRIAGGAMGVAEAGIAEALTFMRANGTGSLTCEGPNTGSTLCSNDWGYNYPTAGAGGHAVSLGGGRVYKVWIQRIQAYTPSATPPDGRFRIHSTGTQGVGPGSRTVTVEVRTKPYAFPLGIFGRDYIRSTGTPSVSKESIFSRGCVGRRNNFTFDTTANDLAHPELVPAVHSARYTSDAAPAGDADCSSTDRRNIHRPSPGPGFCNTNYRYDRDLQGGPLSGTSCNTAPGGRGLTNSYFDENILKTYGYGEPRGLPADQYAFIKQLAQAQGNYYDCIARTPAGACNNAGDLTNFSPLNGSTLPNAVAYVRLAAGKKLTLTPSMLTGYGTAFCGQRSFLLVVEGGDLDVNNNVDVVGAIFVPDGRSHVNGGAKIVGALFSKELFVNGNAHFTLEGQCYFNNLPGPIQVMSPSNFAQLDR